MQSGLEVKRLAGALGAEIKGLNLADGNYDNLFPALYQAFLDHQVIMRVFELRGSVGAPDYAREIPLIDQDMLK